MSPRTSTTEAILQALEAGPATAEQLRSGSRRRQGLIDKALTDLANDGRIVAVRWDEDPDDQPHWQLAATPEEPSPEIALELDGQPSNSDTGETDETSTALMPEASREDMEPAELPADQESVFSEPEEIDGSGQDAPEASGEETETTKATEPGDDDRTLAPTSTDIGESGNSEETDGQIVIYEPETEQDSSDSTPETSIATNPEAEPSANPATGTEPEAPAEVKACRGCQEQMPVVCPCCQQKTTSYCGECRTKRVPRRRSNGESELLSNGLPKLRRGELVSMVEDVMRQHPIPEFNGVIGWTSSRIAVHLPGRSTGAIGEALTRLTATGKATLLDESPRRYVLVTTSDMEAVENANDNTSPDGELN